MAKQKEQDGFLLFCLLEATTGFEPVIRVLQTLALPLGHVALHEAVYSATTGFGDAENASFVIRVLQPPALWGPCPCHLATSPFRFSICRPPFERRIKIADLRSISNPRSAIFNHKAGDGTRTHDLLLGKETFYH